jgi:Coiled-coil domain-containing protein 124 /Oxs1
VSEDEYHQQVIVPNINRKEADAIDARSVEQALEALDFTDSVEDRHPERSGRRLLCHLLPILWAFTIRPKQS